MAKEYIDEYSKKGLRTLVLGKKRLTEIDKHIQGGGNQ